ncbi:hypothetical protein MHPYR_510018 [uncultured Mycobacterium sp.]|uniref:Uncharacterized protein n=1 Tax=uncultured Mycobacterium sp. TaxID=171292 RepID=A0A1Y5PHI9_9MYCO|nr:hypothetical protein MHPYR_510018 [uncultured Mycobacterium sp.]
MLYPLMAAHRACSVSATAADTGSEAGGVTVTPVGEAPADADATAPAVWVTAAVSISSCATATSSTDVMGAHDYAPSQQR